MKLKERSYICECRTKIDTDINVAINIKNEGLRQLEIAKDIGQELSEYKLVDFV